MGGLQKPAVSTRLKREDCKRTKHDSSFSDWKILIGHSDWEDHLLGKEGAERYRTQNLPNCSSCSGVYELGIAISHPRSGRQVSKLDPDFIIPVYLGQADNVRTRLQRYGREGAHLENGNSLWEGLGLFKEIFARGFSIVYRWAPMKSKRDAEKTEAQLLDKFDYAWNKGSNGARRPQDILKKLDQNASIPSPFHQISRKFQIFPQKKVGIKIQVCPPLLPEKKNDFLPHIFKFGRSRFRLVSVKTEDDENRGNICGVALGHGSVCIRPPVEGRKRCPDHKGMKVNGLTSKSIADVKLPFCPSVKPHQISPVCGVLLCDGSPCTNEPALGRKRCEEHKGMRVGKKPVLELDFDQKFSVSAQSVKNSSVSAEFSQTCGAALRNGSFCRRKVKEGNKRCWQHKGSTDLDWLNPNRLTETEAQRVENP